MNAPRIPTTISVSSHWALRITILANHPAPAPTINQASQLICPNPRFVFLLGVCYATITWMINTAG